MITEKIYDLNSYQYDLPRELIAQYPVEPRDSARLLVVDRQSRQFTDAVFRDITAYIKPGDTLVLNETRVIPARLYGFKDTGARVEILLLRRGLQGWEALVRPAKRLKKGTKVFFPDSMVEVEIIDYLEIDGGRLIAFNHCPDEDAFINQVGHMPLPPYINREADQYDNQRYQTVFARQTGSAAAPTAGLHFTETLIKNLQGKGVNLATVVLHVGLGTFRPVTSQDIRQHQMHSEYYEVDDHTAQLLNETRQNGGHIVAVGTTVVRTLESIYDQKKGFVAGRGETAKFIYPGYTMKAIDWLITNFHLPGSSLIMLVAALAGLDLTREAYRYAVEEKYRFFSYGDAMLIK